MDNRILVIYKSKTGFTEQYAKWIAEELSCDIVSYKDRKKISFENYDMVIYGGGFFAGMISGLGWLKKKFSKLKGKKIVVFATGATAADSPEVEKALKLNFTPEQWDMIKTFYMESGLCFERMGTFSRFIMTKFSNSADSPVQNTSFDHSSKENVYPLIEYCGVKKKEEELSALGFSFADDFK